MVHPKPATPTSIDHRRLSRERAPDGKSNFMSTTLATLWKKKKSDTLTYKQYRFDLVQRSIGCVVVFNIKQLSCPSQPQSS